MSVQGLNLAVVVFSMVMLMESNVEPDSSLPVKPTSNRWRVIAICLILIVGSQLVFLFTLYSGNVALKNSYDRLNSEYAGLQSNYNDLQINYSTLEGNYSSFQSAYLDIRKQINLHSAHPTEDEKQLVTPNDSDVQNLMLQVTSGWSNRSDWNEFWSDLEKLYDWVTTNVKYSQDPVYPYLSEDPSSGVSWVEDFWRFPNETLRTSQGDCDDQALLLLSLILAYTSEQRPAYCIIVTGHAATFLPVGEDKICILDSTGHYTTNSGWPSYDLTSKDINAEVGNWLSHLGDSRQVRWIFSNSFWHEFSGTEDFITWVYSNY